MKKALVIGLVLVAAGYLAHELRMFREPEPWNISEPPATELKVLQRASYYIKNNYIEPDRLNPKELLKNGLIALQKGLAPVMLHWAEDHFVLEVAGEKRRFAIPADLSLEQFPFFLGHIADFISAEIPEALQTAAEEEKNLEYLLLDGIVSTLDPHSNFLSPRVYSEFKIGTKGNFGGIGIAIGIQEGHLTVIAPLEGTPAARAGIQAKDRIVQIGDERTINMSLTEAVERLRGKIGTEVTLVVEREGVNRPLTFTIRRALIKIDSVKAEMTDGNIILVRIKNFQEDTTAELYRQLRELGRRAGEVKGIILDLRNNPGGLLDQAVSVADAFLAEGTIVATVGFNDQLEENDRARASDPYENLSLVVLVNEGSASASEIVAGALQLHNRALIIGNRTFGKGSVQTIYDLKDGSAIKLTIAKYLAAGTEDVQADGMTPDLELIPMRITEERIDLVADVTRREGDLEAPLAKSEVKTTAREPLFRLRYLAAAAPEEPDSATVQLLHDYPVQLARTILTERSAFSREALLQEIDPIIKEAETTQHQKLTEQLSTLGIDWQASAGPIQSPGETTDTPEAVLRFWITKGEETTDHIQGGEEIELHLEVTNGGKGVLERLIAITESDNPFLDELEFPLGRLDAGASRSHSVPVTVPAAIVPRQEPITFRFEEAHGHAPIEQKYPLLVVAPPLPRFAYRWRFQEGVSGPVIGSDIDLLIEVENRGVGRSEQPVVNLTNLEGEQVFLARGRATLEPIAPGETRTAQLTFRLRDGYEKDRVRFRLSIEDHHTADYLQDQIVLSLANQPHDPPPEERQVSPTLELSLPTSPYWSEEKRYTFTGLARDDRAIKQVYVFVGTDKIFYQANQNGDRSTLPFTVTVPLQVGENRITVVAEDDGELIGREAWVVWKPE